MSGRASQSKYFKVDMRAVLTLAHHISPSPAARWHNCAIAKRAPAVNAGLCASDAERSDLSSVCAAQISHIVAQDSVAVVRECSGEVPKHADKVATKRISGPVSTKWSVASSSCCKRSDEKNPRTVPRATPASECERECINCCRNRKWRGVALLRALKERSFYMRALSACEPGWSPDISSRANEEPQIARRPTVQRNNVNAREFFMIPRPRVTSSCKTASGPYIVHIRTACGSMCSGEGNQLRRP